MDTENNNGNSAIDEANEFTGRSVAEIRLAAEQGNFRASNILGTLYYEGKGVRKDEAEGARWWQLADQQQHDANVTAAEEGDVEAQYGLGMEYVWGSWATDENSEEYNQQEARKWFRLAAEQKHAAAQYELGMLYRGGWILPGDPAECFKWVQRAAEQGDAEASQRLGHMFLDGSDGAPQDFVEAAKWFRLAAEQGDHHAMFQLARLYARGHPGLPQDDERAVGLYMLAAEQGVAAAQNKLGEMYDAGRGIKQDFRKAAKWFRLSAKQGDETAQFNLGLMYQDGSGVSKNDEKAAKWYRLAARQSYPWASLALGLLRENLDDLKDAAKGLFNLHHAVEYLPLGETHIQMGRLKGQLADLIAEKSKEQSKANRSIPTQTPGGDYHLCPLAEWKVASTLRGMLELMSQSIDTPSATECLERSLKEDDPLAGYYLAVLAIRHPQKSSNQKRALDHLDATMSRLQSYGELSSVLDKGSSDELTQNSYYGKEFETWLLGAARQKHSEIKLALAKEEIHKQTLSFLTHTLNNALSTGPETVRTVIEILGSDLYDRGQEQYKAINNMASLFPVFLFAESLLRTFKLYVSDPEQIREKWKNDKSGDANVSLVMAMALRQSVARFVFSSNHLTQLKRLLPGQDKEAIKNIRKSFVDEIIPLEITVKTAGKIFQWIAAHLGVLQVRIDADAEMSFTSNATRYMFFFAAFSELIYNALKYADGQQPIAVKWFRHNDEYCFACVNSCPPTTNGQVAQEGTNKGLYFIDKLMSMLEDSALCCVAENGEYRALLTFGHKNFAEGSV